MKIPDNATLVFKGKTFNVYQWEQEMFDGRKKTWERLKRNHSVDIIAISPENEIYILEEQQPGRPPFFWLVWGTCEDGEDPMETAKRELLEETGLVSNDWALFWTYTASSRIDHDNHILIARGCVKKQDQSLDEGGELIDFKKLKWEDFLQTVANPKFRVKEFALEALRYVFLGKEEELKDIIFQGKK